MATGRSVKMNFIRRRRGTAQAVLPTPGPKTAIAAPTWFAVAIHNHHRENGIGMVDATARRKGDRDRKRADKVRMTQDHQRLAAEPTGDRVDQTVAEKTDAREKTDLHLHQLQNAWSNTRWSSTPMATAI